MDRKYQQNPEILRLTARSAAARNALAKDVVKLRQHMDVAGRIRETLRGKTSTLLIGSTIAGLAAGLLIPRSRRSAPAAPAHRGSSALQRVLGMAWSAAQPFVKMWLTNQLQTWLAQRAISTVSQPSSQNPPR